MDISPNMYSGIWGYSTFLFTMRTGCMLVVCAYWTLSDCERCDRDVTCRLQVSNLSGTESWKCVNFHTGTCGCMHSVVCITNVHVRFLWVYGNLFRWAVVYSANSKQSATSPKTIQALTVTQSTAQNTWWDDGDGWQPRQHMGLILDLMKTTWHKYRTKRTALETCTIPLQYYWHWCKHSIILGVFRWEKGEWTGEKAELGL